MPAKDNVFDDVIFTEIYGQAANKIIQQYKDDALGLPSYPQNKRPRYDRYDRPPGGPSGRYGPPRSVTWKWVYTMLLKCVLSHSGEFKVPMVPLVTVVAMAAVQGTGVAIPDPLLEDMVATDPCTLPTAPLLCMGALLHVGVLDTVPLGHHMGAADLPMAILHLLGEEVTMDAIRHTVNFVLSLVVD